jgi:hypothetical protein
MEFTDARYEYQPPDAGPCLSIYVSLCFGPIWLSPVTRLLVKAIYVIHLAAGLLLPPNYFPQFCNGHSS